jgi:hypothetical protein
LTVPWAAASAEKPAKAAIVASTMPAAVKSPCTEDGLFAPIASVSDCPVSQRPVAELRSVAPNLCKTDFLGIS